MDAIDAELLSLINKLNRIQREIGGKKNNANNPNGFFGGDSKVDRFMDIQNRMNERIETIKNAVDDINKLEKVPGGSNPKELIGLQSKVRTELIAISEEWKELDMVYRIEVRKKRSRYTKEELEARERILTHLQGTIQELKDIQRAGYVKGYQGYKMATMEESEIFKKRDVETGETKTDKDGNVTRVTTQARGVVGKRNNAMTDNQRDQLLLIKERDQKIDQEIEEIGKGIDVLHEIALQANQEIKQQNKMLDVLEEKVNDVHDNVANINEKLKVTLDKARSSDKICMDIFCLIILIGMIIVLVKLNNDNSKK